VSKYDGCALDALSGQDIVAIVDSAIDLGDIATFVDVLMMLGGSNRGINGQNVDHYRSMILQRRGLASLYPKIVDFAVDRYSILLAEENRVIEKAKCSSGLHYALRDICVAFLNFHGCACGKKFDYDMFEEDGTHYKCDLYKRWAWAHIPYPEKRKFGF
jgi:hypothetical protein